MWTRHRAGRLTVWIAYPPWGASQCCLAVERKWPGRAQWNVIIDEQWLGGGEIWGVWRAKRAAIEHLRGLIDQATEEETE